MEMLNNSSTAPWNLQFALLRKITDGFSEERKVGSGTYGKVYKGKLDNGEEIAVKKLYPRPGLDDKQFMNEFSNLIKVQHENIVRLVGYCYDEQDEFVQHNGKLVLAQREYRMLCFEYLHGGSLDKHLYQEHCGLDWHTRYKIIKGICEGLNYLHGLKESILHLDLKPANILLDKNMVPKIADFGLSRLFGETRTHITENCIGTKRYMPPEFILECKITKKYDVFSLGVIIIEIMTGREGYSKYHETSTSEQFIELVHNKWKVRIEATSIHTSPEEDCKQVKRCIEIALNCVEAERHKRPTIGDIIHKLRETETMHHEVSMSFSQEPGSVSSHFKREMVHMRLETMEEKRGGQGEEDEKAGFSKIGPWGGNAGRAHDIKVSSYRLESVTIWCADIVDALAFSYSDLNGKMHTVGPWGGPGGSPRTIKVGPSEFLMEVSGTTGPYILAATDVVRSLMLVTNAGSYGPFGQGGGTAFRTSVQSNDSIVGFFGRAERFVHAIGVYVKPNLPTLAASRHFEREMDQMVRDEKIDSELETIQGERGKEDDDVLSEIQLSPRPEPARSNSKENELQHTSVRPRDITFRFLEDITNGFSEERKLGSGGYGKVYKGLDKNGKVIAVKKLHHMPGLDDVQFRNEFNSLTRVQHQNIVRLVGYCYEVRHTHVEHNREFVVGKIIDRVLCLEYLQGGSLERHLDEESCGHDWRTRYKIIKGICEGLNYLHGESIFHLDLKPGNILLDKNMVPKIADFGLSRLFGGTHTRPTKNRKGTEYYMPPEYISKRQISNKYDVYSLGVIIIEIMTGPMGYSRYNEMSHQQIIEHVHNNWRDRIEQETSKYAEEDCQQVKRCIEIALNCVDVERHKRPTIKDIIRELTQTETGSASSGEQAKIAKIGQWGGVGGSYIDTEVAPGRLKSLIIGSGEVIYSLEFSYYDHNGQQHTAGPWGGHGPKGHGSDRHKINLGPSEFLTEVHGTIGPFDPAPAGVIKSLTFITNARSYGPFGEVQGTPFQIPVRSNGSIVGFFGRTGWYVDAFGIYVNPKQETMKEEEAGLAKIGPWGGNGGMPHDIRVAPHRLESITIRSGVVVDSLSFSYRDRDGQQHTAGPWGGYGASDCTETIQLGRSEFLTGVYGTTGPFAHASGDVVTSLTLVTNARSCGPFGRGGETPFHIPMWSNGTIVGFFGRAGSSVNAIGVYVNPKQEEMQQVIRLEPLEFLLGVYGTVGPFGTLPNVITSLTFATNHGRGYGPFGQGGGALFNAPAERDGCIVGFFGRAGSCVEALGVYIHRY